LKFLKLFENKNDKYVVYKLKLPGDFDANNIDFESFEEAINYVINVISEEFAIKSFGIEYTIKKCIIEETTDDFELWKETKKYNI